MKHPDILSIIDDKLDQKIRNIKIRTVWDYMKAWTDVPYTKRIEHLMSEYHLSFKSIEAIVHKEE